MASDLVNRAHQLQQSRRQTASRASGELPGEIEALVDNKAFLPRHRKLQREYGDEVLLKLAELAQSKDKPSHWYAKVTSVKCWDRTLKMVKKLIAAAKRAVLAMEKLGAKAEWLPWYTSITYRNSEATVAGWVEQASRGRNPARYFGWLAGHAE